MSDTEDKTEQSKLAIEQLTSKMDGMLAQLTTLQDKLAHSQEHNMLLEQQLREAQLKAQQNAPKVSSTPSFVGAYGGASHYGGASGATADGGQSQDDDDDTQADLEEEEKEVRFKQQLGSTPTTDPATEMMASMIKALSKLGQPKLDTPIFSGKGGQNPMSHILRAKDWMDQHEIGPRQRSQAFRHTLDGKARLWYDGLGDTSRISWLNMQEQFAKHYSPQGRTPKQLYDK